MNPFICRHARLGFTMVEILIVLAVLSVVLVMAVGGVTSRSGAMDRTALAIVQGTLTKAQVQARRDEGHVISVVTGGTRVSVYRDGVEIPAYAGDLPVGYTLTASTTIVQSDGTLNAPSSLVLSNAEITYVLRVERSGVAHF